MIKRIFDIVVATMGLVVLAPFLACIAAAVRLSSPGPVLFRHRRVGLGGSEFSVLKFRTMTVRQGSEAGRFDPGDKSRVTALGAFLRKWKLDELPQLWNVIRGEMSLVGPRPDVRKWVSAYPERWARVHTVKPGITSPAAIAFRHEEEMLAASQNPEVAYRDQILPRKLDYYIEYVESQTFLGDLVIIVRTLLAIVFGSQPELETEPRGYATIDRTVGDAASFGERTKAASVLVSQLRRERTELQSVGVTERLAEGR